MDEQFEFNTLLVPTDFSPMARIAFQDALKLAKGKDANVIVLHVIDPAYAEFAEEHGLASKESMLEQMRNRADKKMSEYTAVEGSPVKVTKMICQGTPFLQIIDHARDLLVNAVIIGKVGRRDALEKLLFGSTAEKVIRGCPCPVIVLPVATE